MSAPSGLGPTARAALASPVKGTKRRKILGLLAVAADRGLDDPSIASLQRASGYPRGLVVSVIESLERDGLLSVDRTGTGEPLNRRATYVIHIDPDPKGTDPTMTTKATTKPPEKAAAPTAEVPAAPAWQRVAYYPETARTVWPALADARAKHDAAATALAEARASGDADAERTALLALADTIIEADRTLRASYTEAQEDFASQRAGVSRFGTGDRIPDGEWAGHRANMDGARPWIEADAAAFERVRDLTEERVFLADFLRQPTEADHIAPAVSEPVARATVLKRELAT